MFGMIRWIKLLSVLGSELVKGKLNEVIMVKVNHY